MAQLNVITLNSVKYYPKAINANGIATLQTRADSNSLSETLTVRVKTNNQSRTTAVEAKLHTPFVADDLLNANKKQMHGLRAEVRIVLPGAATLTQRQAMLAKVKALVSDAIIQAGVEYSEGPF